MSLVFPLSWGAFGPYSRVLRDMNWHITQIPVCIPHKGASEKVSIPLGIVKV